MATSKKFSELTAASSLTANDLAAVAHVDAQAETGYESQKATMSQLGQYLNKEMQYATDLSKFPVGSQSPIPALNNLRDFLYGQLPVNSASGSIANFTTSLALPLVALKAYITAQGGGGTPSAPVAITGVDSVKIYQRGGNLWDGDWESGDIDISGNNTVNSSSIRSKNYIPISPNVAFYCVAPSNYGRARYYDKNKNYIGATDKNGYTYIGNTVRTMPSNAYYLRFAFTTESGDSISVNYPSTDTQYHAYNPNSTEYTIQLGQTCYGGEVGIDGSGTQTHSLYTFTGSESWTWVSADGGYWRFTKPAPRAKSKSAGLVVLTENGINLKIVNASYVVCLASENPDISSSTNMNTLFPSGSKMCFEMETSTTFSVTPVDITALVGENNIFADSGDIEVSFKMGVQEYIDKKIAETQALVL